MLSALSVWFFFFTDFIFFEVVLKENKQKLNRTFIGGQALMEGVMMQGATSMAMTVRTESGDILTETKRLSPKKWYNKVPVLRGCVAFIKSLVGGTSALMKSAEVIYPEEETPGKASFAIAAVLGVVFAVALFILLPSFIASMIDKYLISLSVLAFALIEGLLRILIFVLYLLIVSRMKDIRRTFMYHGAEHRTINCFEHGLELTVENVQKCSTRHNRCGTTFLFFVMVVSILVFSLATWILSLLGWSDLGVLAKMGIRLLLLPFVAGLSYELLRFLAILPDNFFVNIFRAPGLALQRLTTYPPEDEMAEIAIISFNLVREMDADPTIKPHKFGEFTMPQLKKFVSDKLAAAGITEQAETDWLIAAALGLKRGELSSVEKTDYKQYRKVSDYAAKRVKGVPLDYITGYGEFYGFKVKVNENVLIPRLDTEILADEVIKYLNRTGKDCEVLDLMTGSGCIALAIAKKTSARVTASDVSAEAIKVAEQNLAGTGAQVVMSDGFKSLPDKTFDLIVSNPPYIRRGEIDSLAPDVTCQPRIALDGGEDGLDFYRLIALEAPVRLTEGGMLFLEIGFDQREEVTALLDKDFTDIECIKDYGGNDRVIVARKKH